MARDQPGSRAFQPFRDFEGMPEPLRNRTFDRAERKFDLMQELGTDLVLVCSNVSPAAIGGIDRWRTIFANLAKERHGAICVSVMGSRPGVAISATIAMHGVCAAPIIPMSA